VQRFTALSELEAEGRISEVPNLNGILLVAGSVWFGDWMRNARRGEPAKSAKTNGDPASIRTRDPQLRRLIQPDSGERQRREFKGLRYAHVHRYPPALV
jgi:hypothetical protein